MRTDLILIMITGIWGSRKNSFRMCRFRL